VRIAVDKCLTTQPRLRAGISVSPRLRGSVCDHDDTPKNRRARNVQGRSESVRRSLPSGEQLNCVEQHQFVGFIEAEKLTPEQPESIIPRSSAPTVGIEK
jgi:hypothetical protein